MGKPRCARAHRNAREECEVVPVENPITFELLQTMLITLGAGLLSIPKLLVKIGLFPQRITVLHNLVFIRQANGPRS